MWSSQYAGRYLKTQPARPRKAKCAPLDALTQCEAKQQSRVESIEAVAVVVAFCLCACVCVCVYARANGAQRGLKIQNWNDYAMPQRAVCTACAVLCVRPSLYSVRPSSKPHDGASDSSSFGPRIKPLYYICIQATFALATPRARRCCALCAMCADYRMIST